MSPSEGPLRHASDEATPSSGRADRPVLIGLARVLASPLSETAEYLSSMLVAYVPHSALVIFPRDCGGRPQTMFGVRPRKVDQGAVPGDGEYRPEQIQVRHVGVGGLGDGRSVRRIASTARPRRAVISAKDADGLHPTNLGRLVLGEPGPLPCTPGLGDPTPVAAQSRCLPAT